MPSLVSAQVTEDWISYYSGPGSDYSNTPSGISIGSDGNVYVTGYIVGGSSPPYTKSFVTIKYDKNGTQLWAARHGVDHRGEPELKATDYVYVAGTGVINEKYVGTIIQYGLDGNELWIKQQENTTNLHIVTDALGYLYATMANGPEYNGDSISTIKYDSNGNQLWSTRYNNDMGTVPSAITIDASDQVFVTGVSLTELPSLSPFGASYDVVTIKYDTDGNQLWVATYDGSGFHSSPAAIAVDLSGNVYVTCLNASFSDMMCSVTCRYYNYATIKYDPNGNHLWTALYPKDGSTLDYNRCRSGTSGLVVDPDGNVYISGCSTIKYDSNGNELWSTGMPGYALAIDPDNNIYITGSNDIAPNPPYNRNLPETRYTIKYDTYGNELWTYNHEYYYKRMVLDSEQNIFLTGTRLREGSYTDYVTARLTHSPQDIDYTPQNSNHTHRNGCFIEAIGKP